MPRMTRLSPDILHQTADSELALPVPLLLVHLCLAALPEAAARAQGGVPDEQVVGTRVVNKEWKYCDKPGEMFTNHD